MNIGLALVVLSLFSVLKKQPCSAPVYFARRVAGREALPLYPSFSLARLRPTASWISRAFRVTEDEVLRIQGLDALVVLRLFKFGVHFTSEDAYRLLQSSCNLPVVSSGAHISVVRALYLF
ncbi:hypothetical protein BHE74_00017506 [Ensete ventricosum]|nr:hypothetical protein BHE74_00017506 [Ensete ventricosum]